MFGAFFANTILRHVKQPSRTRGRRRRKKWIKYSTIARGAQKIYIIKSITFHYNFGGFMFLFVGWDPNSNEEQRCKFKWIVINARIGADNKLYCGTFRFFSLQWLKEFSTVNCEISFWFGKLCKWTCNTIKDQHVTDRVIGFKCEIPKFVCINAFRAKTTPPLTNFWKYWRIDGKMTKWLKKYNSIKP